VTLVLERLAPAERLAFVLHDLFAVPFDEIRGAPAVAGTFSGRARVAQPALANGAPGAVWAPGGRPHVVFAFTFARGKIVEIYLVADPARLRQLDLSILND